MSQLLMTDAQRQEIRKNLRLGRAAVIEYLFYTRLATVPSYVFDIQVPCVQKYMVPNIVQVYNHDICATKYLVSRDFIFPRHESLNQPMIHFDAAISTNESETENKNETKSNRPTEII